MAPDYTWLMYAILSALFAALVAIFGKVGLQGVDSTTATAVRSVIMAVFLIGVVIALGKTAGIEKVVGNSDAMKFIVLSGVAGALSWLFYFFALQSGKVSQVVPIDRSSVVFALVLAVLFLGEKITLQSAAGAVLIVVGAILVALA
ncbi:MAG: EamA family transporter [Candidatus Micrarchaeota archaeon]|nr:EamA family transporter [Candidatus Micrarchaeota archaeon]